MPADQPVTGLRQVRWTVWPVCGGFYVLIQLSAASGTIPALPRTALARSSKICAERNLFSICIDCLGNTLKSMVDLRLLNFTEIRFGRAKLFLNSLGKWKALFQFWSTGYSTEELKG